MNSTLVPGSSLRDEHQLGGRTGWCCWGEGEGGESHCLGVNRD